MPPTPPIKFRRDPRLTRETLAARVEVRLTARQLEQIDTAIQRTATLSLRRTAGARGEFIRQCIAYRLETDPVIRAVLKPATSQDKAAELFRPDDDTSKEPTT